MGSMTTLQVLGAFKPLGAHSDGLAIATAQELAPGTVAPGATKLVIQVLTQNARYTLDGTTPQAALGFQLKAGDPPVMISYVAGVTVTVIEEAATADLQYQWGE